MRAFHATEPSKVESIRLFGIRPCCGEVYLADTADTAVRWKSLTQSKVAVIEVEIDGRTLQTGFDHSPLMLKICGITSERPSLVTTKPIPASAIRAVHIYAVKRKQQNT